MCLLSRGAINHPTVAWQNFSKLEVGSRCDNVFLEHRLAVELRNLGMLEKIFPVMIGDPDGPIPAANYGSFFGENCLPVGPDTHVESVEAKLVHHLDSMALGLPVETNKTVKAVITDIMACQVRT